jgi:hypothetical protein
MAAELTELVRTWIVAPALGNRAVYNFLRQQINVVRYVFSPVKRPSGLTDRRYVSNQDFWGSLQHPTEPLRPNTVVHLQGFAITEWLPRTPGLFHTAHAARRRAAAENNRMSENEFLRMVGRYGNRSRSDDVGRRPVSVL